VTVLVDCSGAVVLEPERAGARRRGWL